MRTTSQSQFLRLRRAGRTAHSRLPHVGRARGAGRVGILHRDAHLWRPAHTLRALPHPRRQAGAQDAAELAKAEDTQEARRPRPFNRGGAHSGQEGGPGRPAGDHRGDEPTPRHVVRDGTELLEVFRDVRCGRQRHRLAHGARKGVGGLDRLLPVRRGAPAHSARHGHRRLRRARLCRVLRARGADRPRRADRRGVERRLPRLVGGEGEDRGLEDTRRADDLGR